MIVTRVDDEIRQSAFDWIASRAHIARPMERDDVHIAFVDEDTNDIQACMLFSDYDGHNIFVHLAIDNPRACKRDNIKLMFNYAFEQCECARMSAMCVNGYERNEKLLAGVGFVKEGVVRQAMKVDGQYVDAALYGILKGECRWV